MSVSALLSPYTSYTLFTQAPGPLCRNGIACPYLLTSFKVKSTHFWRSFKHSSAYEPSAGLTCGTSKPVWQPESSVYHTLRVLKWNFTPLDPLLSSSWQYSPLVTAQQTTSEMKGKMDFSSRENSCKHFPNILPTSNSFTLYQEILFQTMKAILGRMFTEREKNAILHQYLWPPEVKKKKKKA